MRPIHRTRVDRALRLARAMFLLLVPATTPAFAAASPAPQEETTPEPDDGAAEADRWFLAFGGGLLSTSDAPAGTFTFDHGLFGSEPGEFDADYAGGDASAWELSVGLRLRDRLGLGLTWSESSLSDKADIAGRLPHPFLFGSPREVEGTQRGLSRGETAIHLSLRWFVRSSAKVEVAVFGGPSRIELDYELASAVRFDHAYPYDTATYTGVERQRESGSATGYHLGVDAVRWFSKSVGIGGVLRYSAAGIDLDAPDGATVSVDAGGLQAVVDLRFRF